MKDRFLTSSFKRRGMATLLLLCAALFAVVPIASASTASSQPAAGSSYLLSSNQNVVQSNSTNHNSGFGICIGSGCGRTNVPEPAAWAVFGFGALLIAFGIGVRRRRMGPSVIR
ncbi:PEP-CTERM sorting domain-containing protein [Salinisphaera sp. Q1T1-3]|uniref:PEP-CTERM sorting domain-containing protein n=1 Tax=Salinisphaera sp. Q1T1-3 TaxID=2321229 RepID=UPI001314797D|nr:PEP-CTERM sorting domain-containing protein [Salinisphaera sp. Q1T1-3]